MSITEAAFYGGASVVTSTTNLHPNSSRVQACWNGSSIDLNLPLLVDWRPDQVGGPMFYILRKGAGNVVVKVGGTTLTTLSSAGQVALVLLGESGYFIRLKTLGVARPVSRSARDPIANPVLPQTYSPVCFYGTLCDLAVDAGLVPLDGEDGREKCIVPMCQDIITYCRNASREPIRAADIVMPSIIPVQLYRDQFEPDPLHPLAATVLPDEFYEALYRDDRPHALEYQGALGGVSRHPHHLRFKGSGVTNDWTHGDAITDLLIARHYWNKVISYTLDDESEFQVEIRMVLEHTLSSEPGVDPVVDPGGLQDRDYGAWGSIFTLYIFARQLDPTFDDGDTFTPVGASAPVEFSSGDPFVSGLAFDVGDTAAKKFCHPQLVAVAHLPTNFQSPVGESWIPWNDRRLLKAWQGQYTLRGENKVFCYKLRNGSPWVNPADCTAEAYPRDTIDFADIFGNIVFGWTATTNVGATMSLGGGFPRSRPLEFLTWENGLGVGRTYLRPLKPGWDETCGILDVAGGSSGGIAICIDNPYGIDDGSGRHEWPSYEFVECDGHPNEPFEAIGGGHQCFNNGNTDDSGLVEDCCVSTLQQASATATDACVVTTTTYGDFNGADCDFDSQTCHYSLGSSQASMEYEDHNYVMNGNQSLRTISWVRVLPDPVREFSDYTHAGTAGNKMVDLYGTWDFSAATITGTGVSHASVVKALAIYDEVTNPVVTDVIVRCHLTDAKTVSHAVAARTAYVATKVSGYFGVLESTGGNNGTASIRKIVEDVEEILTSINIANFTSGTVDLELDAWGSEITFRWTVSGHAQEELVGMDCELSSGEGGLAIMAESSTSFGTVFFDDETKVFLNIEGTHGRLLNAVSWPLTIPTTRALFIQSCEDSVTNEDCGECCTPPRCNCTTMSPTVISATTTTWSSADSDAIEQNCSGNPTDGYTGDSENPTYFTGPYYRCDCEGTLCSGDAGPRCGECPVPWRALSLGIPSCWPGTQEVDEPRMCSGVTFWGSDGIVCE